MSDRTTAEEEGSGHETAQGSFEKSVNKEKLFKYQAGCCSLPWELWGAVKGTEEGYLPVTVLGTGVAGNVCH